jgi:hypothetical protein
VLQAQQVQQVAVVRAPEPVQVQVQVQALL